MLRNKTLKYSRTSALRLQYMDMVDMMRTLLRTEHTGNWALHIRQYHKCFLLWQHLCKISIRNLLVSMCSKCASFMWNMQMFTRYLKWVIKLVRRSGRLWVGLSVNISVEQVLVGSLKISGDFTSGRGMTEHHRITWLLSMPTCAEVNSANLKQWSAH